MNRIKNTFAKLKGRGEKALILYLMAGDPDLDRTYELILTLDRAGVDILEIGVPFSDPTADGPVIQKAAQRSLRAGTTLAAILEMIERVRKASEIPMVLFSYYNPIFAYGNERFARETKKGGGRCPRGGPAPGRSPGTSLLHRSGRDRFHYPRGPDDGRQAAAENH